MPQQIRETTGTLTPIDAPSGRMLVAAISVGRGSSGYYSADVLREAAENRVIPAGTPMFLDHPSLSQRRDRPERSVQDMAAVFTTDATFDVAESALVGDVQVFSPYRERLSEMAPHLGLSILGSATDITVGVVNGERMPIVEGIARVDSVDWVTRAGRGGRVLALLESDRFLREATADDRALQLTSAIRARHHAPGEYAWVVDHEADSRIVYYRISREGEDDATTWMSGYTVTATDADVELVGEPVQVRRLTTYQPLQAGGGVSEARSLADQIAALLTESGARITLDGLPADPAGLNHTHREEPPMGTIQIEESEHARLTKAAGRVDTLISERDQNAADRDAARAELAGHVRNSRARELIAESTRRFNQFEAAGLLVDLPLTEGGALDEDAFRTRITDAAKALGESGRITGNGAAATTDNPRRTASPWGRKLEG